ncbi:MAG: hypothetical protein KGL53_06945 [Elusimicrobia bacterium]|nr:hypothetical protein [Elusimicrobiota bacterium]
MRSITAALALLGLMLVAGPQAVRAAESSAGGTVKFFSADKRGPTQGGVREYDGNLYNPVEADVWLKTDLDSVLIDLGVKDIGSSNESGRLDLNAGRYLGLESNFGILTHRQPVVSNGIILNGAWTPNRQAHVNYNGADLLFKRTEENAKLWLACPKMPFLRFLAGFWQEQERGTQPLGYDGKTASPGEDVTSQEIDRHTTDVTVGLQADVAKGEVGYTYTARKFADRAPTAVDSAMTGSFSGYPNSDLSWVSEQRTDIHQLAFRFPLMADLHTAGGVGYTERTGRTNGYKVRIVDGNLGALYAPVKDLSVSARLYDHVMNTEVNDAFAAVNNANAPDPRMDFYQMRADVKARYTGIKNVALTAGYKPEHNYRRNGDQRPGDYSGDARYQDGTFQPTESELYGPAVEDTKQQFEVGADVELPADATLSAAYRLLTANRAAYENSPTLGHYKTVALYVPLGEETSFNVNWDGSSEYSHRSPNNFSSRLNRLMFGLQWTQKEGKASLGTGYGFEDGRYRIDAYFGASNTAYNGNNVLNLIHEGNSDYSYKNDVLTANGMTKLPLKLVARGDAAYTISHAHWYVTQFDPYFTGAAAGTHLSDINPSEVRIVRWRLELAREVYKDVSARVSYDQQQWVDKYDATQNGRIGVTEVALAAKF